MKLHPSFHCIALAFMLACSDRGSEPTELDGTQDEPPAPTTSGERADEPSAAADEARPEASVRDKLTCPSGCVKISAVQPSPACCNCNGQDLTWTRSAWSATTWLCK
jgi:hypothetical protein